jgi:hypothetical protein
MNQLLKWKYTLSMFRQDKDIDIESINMSLDNIQFINIKKEYIKTFFYYIYMVNRDNIKKYKLQNRKIKIFEDINIQEILNEHNEILSN